jgi:hypothetical protein
VKLHFSWALPWAKSDADLLPRWSMHYFKSARYFKSRVNVELLHDGAQLDEDARGRAK